MTLQEDFRGHTTVDVDAPEFALGYVYGYRGWKLDSMGRLRGVGYTAVLKPGANDAACAKEDYSYLLKDHPDHRMLRCTCGYYAYFSEVVSEADEYDVMGVLRGTGRTVVGSKGFRASRGELVAAYVPSAKKLPLIFRILRWLLPQSTTNTYNSYGSREYHPGMFVLMLVSTLTGLGLTLPAIVEFESVWFLALIGAPVLLFGVYLILDMSTWHLEWRRDRGERRNKKPEENIAVAALKQFYPNVPIFKSRRAMLKKFPLTNVSDFDGPPRFARTPENTKDFWEIR